MRAVALALIVAACGRIGFDATGSTTDAGTDATNVVGRWRSVSVSYLTTCAITLDGELYCWGSNFFGQAGGEPRVVQDVTRVGTSTGWTAVSVGTEAGCGLDAGALWCWGTNKAGNVPGLALGAVTGPRRIGQDTWTRVTVAGSHGCGIRSDGVLHCWGNGDFGTLGNGSPADLNQPTPVSSVGTNRWTEVATSEETTCGIQTDASLWCWGNNINGQVGNGTSTPQLTPQAVAGGRRWTSVDLDFLHTCAIEEGSAAWCWGRNDLGQLGTGTETAEELTPVQIQGVPPLAAIEVGRHYTCGLTLDGEVKCWSVGERGQFGLAMPHTLTPIVIAQGRKQVSAAGFTTCTIDNDARLACTGGNHYGQAGMPAGAGFTIAPSDTRTDWMSTTAQQSHACGITADGIVHCWGNNAYGELAIGHPYDVQVATSTTKVAPRVRIGSYFSGALPSDGSVYTAGLHPDFTTVTNTFTMYDGPSSTAEGAIGALHACRIFTDLTMSCGGENGYGQLGDGTNMSSGATTVAGTWKNVFAGAHSTCAINGTDQLLCWGDNTDGQLGLGTTNNVNAPQAPALTGSTGVPVEAAIGVDFICVRLSSGQLWCAGAGSFGQIGTGTPSGSTTFVRVGTRSDWRKVVAGDWHACALATDDTLWCWGHGDEGQLGQGAGELSVSAPIQVPLAGGWRDVAAGWHFTCGIDNAGRRRCFGQNQNGELGDGLSWREEFTVIP